MFKYLLETFTHIINYLFSRNSYVCPILIFIFDIDQDQINGPCFPYVLVKCFSAKKYEREEPSNHSAISITR